MCKAAQKLYGFCAAVEAMERVKLLILLMTSPAALFLRALRRKRPIVQMRARNWPVSRAMRVAERLLFFMFPDRSFPI